MMDWIINGGLMRASKILRVLLILIVIALAALLFYRALAPRNGHSANAPQQAPAR